MPLFFRLNAVNDTIFRLNAVKTAFFRLNAVNAFIPAEKRRQCRYFCDQTPSTPVFFRLNAVNAATFPVKRR